MRQYVGVVIIRKDGAVVAQHRDNNPKILGPDTWAVPGGAVEEGEETSFAAFRECEEETSYTPHDLWPLTTDLYTTERGVQVQRNIFYTFYDGLQPIEKGEGQEMRFVREDEFSKLKFYTGHEGFFRKAIDLSRTNFNPERRG